MRVLPPLAALSFLALAVSGCLGAEPAGDESADHEHPEPHAPDESPAHAMQVFEQFESRPAGIERTMRFLTGPFLIPPGNDFNRITVQLPVHQGFLTAVSPNLYDASGASTVNQHMHIHHAHWFRTSNDAEDEYYAANLAWVFGTGEERTQGSLDQRSLVDPDGPAYGIYLEQLGPQALIFMLHNKMPEAALVWVALDVNFVYGSAQAIKAAAKDCPGILDGERCQAGRDFHTLHGKLWGTTFDVPRQAVALGGDGLYVHPIDIPLGDSTRRASDHLGRMFTASADGTAIASAGHLHPNGMEVVVANLGPEGSACEADLDGDGLPGVTLFHSRKIEAVEAAYPHSEDFQMGATKHGWRAPIRAGDRITQFAVYDNDAYASYEAMSFAGLYVDRQQPPAPRGAEGCTLANTAAYLLPGDPWGGDPRETVMNRAVGHDGHDHGGYCGIPGAPACNREMPEPEPGLPTPVVTITNFRYTPGDRALPGQAGLPVQVPRGSTLTFVNADMVTMAGVRHTVTSCEWPCNGPYVANYPQPDGLFDSGKLGNYDPLDGGLIDTGNYGLSGELSPVYELDTGGMEPGLYSFYCRVHPWMRGSLEIV
jgi:hypothetical protein